MGDQNLRVWPVDGDTYGDVVEYPAGASYRSVPIEPGASGDMNHDLVVTERREPGESVDDPRELGRHRMSEVLIAYPGQPTPDAVLESEHARRTTVGGKSEDTKKAGSPAAKK
jgi:hypothetical protein